MEATWKPIPFLLQIISSFESVGEKGKEEFVRLAYLNRICVTQNITVGKDGPVTTRQANLVMTKLLNNTRGRVSLSLASFECTETLSVIPAFFSLKLLERM